MLTNREIEWVRGTWRVASADPDALATCFYERLFTVAPDVEPLFPDDRKAQGRKLVQMLGMAVGHMDRLERIIPAIEACGRRHVGYGALPEHYPVVGDVLLGTLEEVVGDVFTEPAKAAWTRAYAVLSTLMIDAQRALGSAA